MDIIYFHLQATQKVTAKQAGTAAIALPRDALSPPETFPSLQ